MGSLLSAFYESSPRIEVLETPRFDADDPAMVEYLRNNGYAVVKNVCSADEIIHAKELLWQFLSDKSGMLEQDPSTWTDENFSKIGFVENGILCYEGIGQSEFLWFLRLLPKVKMAFSKIFNTSELITSFDGANVFRPWHSPTADEHCKTRGGWFHVDQGIAITMTPPVTPC